MHRFLCWLSSRWRSKCRASDYMFLWPAIAKRAASFEQFIDAATTHMVNDPAWSGHEHEWFGPNSPVTPWEWWRKSEQPAQGDAECEKPDQCEGCHGVSGIAFSGDDVWLCKKCLDSCDIEPEGEVRP